MIELRVLEPQGQLLCGYGVPSLNPVAYVHACLRGLPSVIETPSTQSGWTIGLLNLIKAKEIDILVFLGGLE